MSCEIQHQPPDGALQFRDAGGGGVISHDTEASSRGGLYSACVARIRCCERCRVNPVASCSRGQTAEAISDFRGRHLLPRHSDNCSIVAPPAWIDSPGRANAGFAHLAAPARPWIVLGGSSVSSAGIVMTANQGLHLPRQARHPESVCGNCHHRIPYAGSPATPGFAPPPRPKKLTL